MGPTDTGVLVKAIAPLAPAASVLRNHDVLLSVDDIKVPPPVPLSQLFTPHRSPMTAASSSARRRCIRSGCRWDTT